MVKTRLYLCDPRKNPDCPKRACFLKGGPCEMTTKFEARAWAQEVGEPVPGVRIEGKEGDDVRPDNLRGV